VLSIPYLPDGDGGTTEITSKDGSRCATHGWCDVCEAINSAIFEELEMPNTDSRCLGAHILCAKRRNR